MSKHWEIILLVSNLISNQTRERERDRSVKWIWHLENMVDSTDEIYDIKEHFYKLSYEILNFSDVIDYIIIYSTLMQCQE